MFWRTFFPFIFIFTLVDGFLSNLFYPAKWALLAKDVLILLVYFFFMMQEHVGRWVFHFRKAVGNPTWFFAAAVMIWAVIQIFNPLSPGLVRVSKINRGCAYQVVRSTPSSHCR